MLEGKTVQLEVLKELTPGTSCQAAYRMALEQALNAAVLQLKLATPIQIGVCIVGVESRETQKTLAGVMVEAYLRNANRKKSFFIRYGYGHPRGLGAAIRLSAEMLTRCLWVNSCASTTAMKARQTMPAPSRLSSRLTGGCWHSVLVSLCVPFRWDFQIGLVFWRSLLTILDRGPNDVALRGVPDEVKRIARYQRQRGLGGRLQDADILRVGDVNVLDCVSAGLA